MYKEALKKYLDDLAGRLPVPGGGSAAALCASAGVSLISMVANFTLGKEKYKSVEGQIQQTLDSSEELREKLLVLVDQDALGYKKVSAAYKLAQTTAPEQKIRTQAIQEALQEAVSSPFEVCKNCYQAIRLCPQIAQKGNVNLISDVGVAVILLEAAFQAALMNVDINLGSIKDQEFILKIREILKPLEKETIAIKQEVWNQVKARMI